MFKLGQSGNERGRPKKTAEQRSFELKARFYMADLGIHQVIELAKGTNKQDRKWALDFLADRGFGRPAQSIDADVTTRSLDSSLEGIEAKIAGIVPGAVGGSGGSGSGSGEGTK